MKKVEKKEGEGGVERRVGAEGRVDVAAREREKEKEKRTRNGGVKYIRGKKKEKKSATYARVNNVSAR